jgi:hypothetical protein
MSYSHITIYAVVAQYRDKFVKVLDLTRYHLLSLSFLA